MAIQVLQCQAHLWCQVVQGTVRLERAECRSGDRYTWVGAQGQRQESFPLVVLLDKVHESDQVTSFSLYISVLGE